MRKSERPRSLGEVVRTLFARRPDPYFGNDLGNARRLGGVMWLMYGTVAAILSARPAERAHALAAWLVAASIVVGSLLTGRHWLRRSEAGFDTLLAGSYLGVLQLATLQGFAGSGATAYQELYLLLAVYTAAVHPPRRVATFLLVLSLAACLPLLYQGWTSAIAADVGVRLVLWLALSALTMILSRSCAPSASRCASRPSTRRSLRCRTRSPASGTAAG